MQHFRSLRVATRASTAGVCGMRKAQPSYPGMIMNTVISPPPPVPETIHEAARPAAAAPWPGRLSPRRYRLLLVFLSAIAVTLASEGMQRLAALRANHYLATVGTGAARTELARARWVLLDGDGGVLHSGRTVPAAADVRELAALLSPAAAR